MSQPWWHIQFHRTDNGKCPYLEDFFLSLSGEDQKRIREKLAIVEQHGPQYDEFTDQLNADIWELRFHIRHGIVRLFYFYQPNHTIIITHAVCKKYWKTKRADIQLAMQYMSEHVLRGKQP
jgi:phage-related protein